MKFCIHEYNKTSQIPIYTYFDYSGYYVGVFLCKCKKCGKEKKIKFLKDRQLGELI